MRVLLPALLLHLVGAQSPDCFMAVAMSGCAYLLDGLSNTAIDCDISTPYGGCGLEFWGHENATELMEGCAHGGESDMVYMVKDTIEYVCAEGAPAGCADKVQEVHDLLEYAPELPFLPPAEITALSDLLCAPTGCIADILALPSYVRVSGVVDALCKMAGDKKCIKAMHAEIEGHRGNPGLYDGIDLCDDCWVGFAKAVRAFEPPPVCMMDRDCNFGSDSDRFCAYDRCLPIRMKNEQCDHMGSRECATGLFCSYITDTCVDLPTTEGDECQMDMCPDNLECIFGTCEPPPTKALEGEDCLFQDCADDLFCSEYDQMCYKMPTAADMECDLYGFFEDVSCPDDHFCYEVPESHPVCKPTPTEEGDVCAFSYEDMCPGDLTCGFSFVDNNVVYQCTAPIPLGEACTFGDTCEAESSCDGQTCVALPKLGDDCSNFYYCIDAICDSTSFECVAYKGDGEACDADMEECEASLYCKEGKCAPPPALGEECDSFCENDLFSYNPSMPGEEPSVEEMLALNICSSLSNNLEISMCGFGETCHCRSYRQMFESFFGDALGGLELAAAFCDQKKGADTCLQIFKNNAVEMMMEMEDQTDMCDLELIFEDEMGVPANCPPACKTLYMGQYEKFGCCLTAMASMEGSYFARTLTTWMRESCDIPVQACNAVLIESVKTVKGLPAQKTQEIYADAQEKLHRAIKTDITLQSRSVSQSEIIIELLELLEVEESTVSLSIQFIIEVAGNDNEITTDLKNNNQWPHLFRLLNVDPDDNDVSTDVTVTAVPIGGDDVVPDGAAMLTITPLVFVFSLLLML